MTTNYSTEVLRVSIKFEKTEQTLERMIKYLSVARKAYKQWMELVANYKDYDRAKANWVMWTLATDKVELHNKAMNKLAVYVRCMASYRMLKKSL